MCVYLCVYTQFQNGYDLINIKSIKELIICSYKCVCVCVCVYRETESYLYICLYLLDFLGQSKFQRLWIIFTTNILLLVRSSALIFGDEIWSPIYDITTEKSHQRGHCDRGHVCFSQLEVKIPSIYFISPAFAPDCASSNPDKMSWI